MWRSILPGESELVQQINLESEKIFRQLSHQDRYSMNRNKFIAEKANRQEFLSIFCVTFPKSWGYE